MGLFSFRSRPESACATCGSVLLVNPIEAYGKFFHSTLCLHHFERGEKQRQRTERKHDRATASQCATCTR